MRKRNILLILTFLLPIIQININQSVEAESFPENSQHPILFIHGWTGEAWNWNTMKLRFTNDGWSSGLLYAYTFSDNYNYTADGNIQNAIEISNWVKNIINTTGAEKVDIVGHSMGGISSRYYIKFLDGLTKVDDYVCMGSPHHGVQGGVEVFQSTCAFLYHLNNGDETPGGVLQDILGLRTDPIGGAAYNGTHTSGDVSYTSIYSNGDTICTPFRTSRLVGANNIEVDGFTHNELLFEEDVYGLVKNAIQEELPNTNTIQGYPLVILLGFSSVLISVLLRSRNSERVLQSNLLYLMKSTIL